MKLKYPEPLRLRLSREAVNVLDAIASELGPDVPRRVAVELLARSVEIAQKNTGSTYSSLLIGDRPFRMEDFDGRRKVAVV